MSRLRSSLALVAALPVAAALAVAACSSQGSGRISIRLTDATGDVKSAVVTISQISLHGSGGDFVLMDHDVTLDLVTLASSTVELVEDVVVPTGTYSELRFVITGGCIAVDPDGAGTLVYYASSPNYAGLPEGAQVEGPLKMPSYAQSGLKVKAQMLDGALVVTSGAKILLLDFDVSQSFGHDAGGSESWVMHPVIQGADITLSGNVFATLRTAVPLPTLATTGQVDLSDFTAVLTDVDDGSVKTRDFALVEGTYTATFLWQMPGNYKLVVVGPEGMTFETSPSSSPSNPTPVSLLPGHDVVVPFTITSASAP